MSTQTEEKPVSLNAVLIAEEKDPVRSNLLVSCPLLLFSISLDVRRSIKQRI